MTETLTNELGEDIHVEGCCGKSCDNGDLDEVRVCEDSVKYIDSKDWYIGGELNNMHRNYILIFKNANML